jgi:hypothetical protein
MDPTYRYRYQYATCLLPSIRMHVSNIFGYDDVNTASYVINHVIHLLYFPSNQIQEDDHNRTKRSRLVQTRTIHKIRCTTQTPVIRK